MILQLFTVLLLKTTLTIDTWKELVCGKEKKKLVMSSNKHKNVLINCTHATWARVAPKSNLIKGSTIQKAAALEGIYLFQLENYTYLAKKKKEMSIGAEFSAQPAD